MKRFFAGLFLCSCLATPVQAALLTGQITGGTALGRGSFVKLNPGAIGFSVGNNNFDTNNFYAFDEKQNFLLTQDLVTNFGLKPIKKGTRVDSHFVFFDPKFHETLQANVFFNSKVLGAITLRSQLIASNYLGATHVTYLDPASVGLEPGTDFITLGAPNSNPNGVRANFFSTDSPGDHFRVITLASAVPEPSSWVMMVGGLLGIGLRIRTRRTDTAGFRSAKLERGRPQRKWSEREGLLSANV